MPLEASLLQRWHQLKPLFEQALEAEPLQREALLAELERSQPQLHADLRALLARHAEDAGMTQPAAERAAGLFEASGATADTTLPAARHHLGRRIGPYELVRHLGSGGMGTVYLAERVSGGFRQRVAIKLIGGLHPGLAERFAQERQILAELKHPNIPPLLDGGETDDGMPWFAAEYVEGQTLLDYAQHRAAPLDIRIDLLLRVAEALAYAHRQRVVHRDIKPGNILVTADGAVKLLDFGIAKLLDEDGTGGLTRQALGPMTPEYAAPEQFRGEPLGPATDIYQFGVLAFRLLSGRLPYAADPRDSLAFARAVCELPAERLPEPDPDEPVAELRRLRRAQRRRLSEVLAGCLAKRPEARWPDMAAVIAALEAVRGMTRPGARLTAAVPRLPGVRWSWPRRAEAAAVLLLVAALALLWWPLRAPWTEDPWASSPALYAMGLAPEHLHVARADSADAILRALRAEAEGDLDRSLALLESVHAVDLSTPVPALLLGYWSSVRSDAATVRAWLQAARLRLDAIDDPFLHLLLRFIEAEVSGEQETSLRYAGALLDARPEAWYFRLARAHYFNGRGLRAAALRELQGIEVGRVDHRKLVDAIADRASLGDLEGARAATAVLEPAITPPDREMLQARLDYSAGRLAEAREHFAAAVEEARSVGHLAIEARALLYLGVVEGCLGDSAAAELHLRQAQQRLQARGQYNFAVDALLALSQLAAAAGDAQSAAGHIEQARALRQQQRGSRLDPMIDLFAARLLAEPTQPDAGYPPPVQHLLRARAALQAGDSVLAQQALEEARTQDVEASFWLEEYALLAGEAGLPAPALAPIDPPFQPYARYASRWALDAGASVVPAPR